MLLLKSSYCKLLSVRIRSVYQKIRPFPAYLALVLVWFLMFKIIEGITYEVLRDQEEPTSRPNTFTINMHDYMEQDAKLNFSAALRLSIDTVRKVYGLPERSAPVKRKIYLMISNWRQGASFIQELIGSHPHVLKLYEPLILYKTIYLTKLRNWYQEPGSEKYILDLLSCKFDSFTMGKLVLNKVIFESNSAMQFCLKSHYERELCYDPAHLREICLMFPITLVKFARLKVNAVQSMMKDSSFGEIHVIYVSRDPRATMHSRWNVVKWCKGLECGRVAVLCEDMDSDLTSLFDLKSKYQDRVHILRYEDITIQPKTMTPKMLKGFNLEMTNEVEKYIEEHTTIDLQRKTYRLSQRRVWGWTTEMNWDQVQRVQDVCSDVMERFGYIPVYDENITYSKTIQPFTHAKDFSLV